MQSPLPHDIWITTDAAGFVIDCSEAALGMLGYSARGIKGRELPNMFVRERPRLSELLQAAQGAVTEREADFRPNDRKAIRVRFKLTRGEATAMGGLTLQWTFDVRWPVGMRIPPGVDRRQVITMWRNASMRCVFVPGGVDKRRLIVCADNDEVIHEEAAPAGAAALLRAAELRQLASAGGLSPHYA